MDNEQAKRRKRINLYKRIIIIFIVAMILLPTILCIVLFVRINLLNKELEEVKQLKLEQLYYADNMTENNVANNNPEPNFYPSNSHMSVNNDNTSETEPDTEEVTTEEATTEEPTSGMPIINGIPGATEYSEEVQEALAAGRKVVYLTYDDGPSPNTSILLDVLDQYDVKATFFVNGHPEYEEGLIDIYERGHTVAMHTYTHQYEVVYGGVESFAGEIITLSDYIESVLGIRPAIFRFPGGSSTQMTTEIHTYINYLNENGIVYYDWNVASSDAAAVPLSAEQIYNNVMTGISKKDVSVVLMHDSYGKETSIQATALIIETLQEMDALILPITNETVPVHHGT